ncbi:class B sortase [Lachnobacterium bovis]|uniref:Sortase B n=1 Tax=Lachnobacterium bovis TaxID=140626 RepID=A0A1H9PGC5_9FIRM|nr:class B sortase [Lachnobacterium bovis]SER47204.1 sortase B [Lachnobacterium bovis]
MRETNRAVKMLLGIVIIICVASIGAYLGSLSLKKTKYEDIKKKAYSVQKVEKKSNKNKKSKVKEYPKQTDINFDELYKINPDIYAWIKIPNTNVDYPILRSSDGLPEDYYLEHNVDHSSGYPGCIYTQKRNSPEFTDPNTVIYGHNMKDKSMFATLHKFEDKDFFNANREIDIYTKNYKMKYKIFAAYVTSNDLILEKYDDFKDRAVFDTYLQSILSNQNMKNNIDATPEVTKNSKIITLSTCIGNPDYRYIVQAYLEDDGQGNKWKEEENN